MTKIDCTHDKRNGTPAPQAARSTRSKAGKLAPRPRHKLKATDARTTRRDVGVRDKPTKTQTCIDLLRRPKGASLADLQAATGWQPHSLRGFLAGTVKKKLGLKVVSEKPDDGPRRYRIPSARA